MLSFLHPSLPRSRVSNGSPMGDYVWDLFTWLIQAPQWSFCVSSWSTYTPSSTLQPYQMPPWSSHPLLLIKTLQWLPTRPRDCCSIAKLCPTPCDPMNCSTPGFPVLHYLLEFAQTHVQWVSDAIQLSHPLLPTSPPALNLSQHQGLSQWISSLHRVAKVLKPQLQHQSSQCIFLEDWLVWISFCPRDSQEPLR